MTPVTKGDGPSGATYVACLDCGKQFSYDAKTMRIGKPIDRSPNSGVAPVSAGPGPFARLLAGVPAVLVFFMALFGMKRAGGHGNGRGAADGR